MIENFKCEMCGECCRWPGYVRVYEKEIDEISRFLDISVDTFLARYTDITHDRKSLTLIENDRGECIFLTDEGCAINDVKPHQCKTFPFDWTTKIWTQRCAWAIKNMKDEGS